MADEDACFSCGNNERHDLPPRERVYIGPGWRVAHAFGTALPGWLVLLPRRHVIALDELTPEEAEELGLLLPTITRALREATGPLTAARSVRFSRLWRATADRRPVQASRTIGVSVVPQNLKPDILFA